MNDQALSKVCIQILNLKLTVGERKGWPPWEMRCRKGDGRLLGAGNWLSKKKPSPPLPDSGYPRPSTWCFCRWLVVWLRAGAFQSSLLHHQFTLKYEIFKRMDCKCCKGYCRGHLIPIFDLQNILTSSFFHVDSENDLLFQIRWRT
jgi:hypothetical protein